MKSIKRIGLKNAIEKVNHVDKYLYVLEVQCIIFVDGKCDIKFEVIPVVIILGLLKL